MNLRAGAENFLEPLHAEVVLLVCRTPLLVVVLPADGFRSSCRLVVELLGEQVVEATGVVLSSEPAAERSLEGGTCSDTSLLECCSEESSESETETWTGSIFSGSPLDLTEDPVSGSPLEDPVSGSPVDLSVGTSSLALQKELQGESEVESTERFLPPDSDEDDERL